MGEESSVERKPKWDPIKEVMYVIGCIALAMSVHAIIWGTSITINMYTQFKLPVGAKEALLALHKARLEPTNVTIDRDAKSFSVETTKAPSAPGEPVKYESITVDYSAMSDSDFEAMANYIEIEKTGFRYKMNSVKYSLLIGAGAYILISLIRFARRPKNR